MVTAYRGDTATRDTKSFYGGDRVTTIPPRGGVPSTVFSDARGRTTELVQYTTAPTVNGDVVSGGDPQSTRYTYNISSPSPADRIAAMRQAWLDRCPIYLALRDANPVAVTFTSPSGDENQG